MEVLDVSGGERSSEIGMQHVGHLSSTTTLHSVPTRSPPVYRVRWSAGARWSSNQNANLPVAGSDPARRRNSPTNFEHRWCHNGYEPGCQTSLVNESDPIRARAGDHQAFAALTDPYRRELQLHCYRILGQVQDAEDAVQETLLSAWRALESFEERSTLRSWLYRIATNRCLNMLRDSGRRPRSLPGLAYTPPEPTRYGEVLWLEPYPDALLEGIADGAAGPEARYETREAVTLAFLTALHRLPPRQRAVLVLRDVMGFSATEVAEMLDTTPTSVNSALIRARTTIEERELRLRDRAPLPRSAQEHELVARFADAFERGDVEPIVALLAEDAWLTMPPEPHEYQGHDAIKQVYADAFARRGSPHRLIPTRANSQPAFAQYVKDPHTDVGRAFGLLVLTLDGDRISHITRFAATSALPHFGLPRTIPW
jgi:RNA polymerase sigma-70 factor (TIGR02960 family)